MRRPMATSARLCRPPLPRRSAGARSSCLRRPDHWRSPVRIAGREVQISNPDKVFFPLAGYTKGDLLDYYLAVAEGALRGVSKRPMALKRFVHGAEGEAFFQKRAPANRPPWIETAVRSDDLDHPDELRIDLDPMPGVPWSQVREVALAAKGVLDDMGLTGWPKTSGSRGMHIYCRIERNWTHPEVRRAAVAFAREVERRVPTLTTSKWWKEERHGVFLDYNQNAKDRTIASAYSVRPTPDARVSTPLRWDEVPDCQPEAFTLATVPKRFAELGDPHANIDAAPGPLEKLLELAAKDEAAGLGDAPWPPHFRKMEGEAPRVAPSRAKPSANKRRTKMPLIVVAN